MRFFNRKEQICMIFCHEAYDGDVYSIDWWVTVTKKGLYTDLFDGE